MGRPWAGMSADGREHRKGPPTRCDDFKNPSVSILVSLKGDEADEVEQKPIEWALDCERDDVPALEAMMNECVKDEKIEM